MSVTSDGAYLMYGESTYLYVHMSEVFTLIPIICHLMFCVCLMQKICCIM